jgi:hypothetical protein
MKYLVSYAYTFVGSSVVEAASRPAAEKEVMDRPLDLCPGAYLEDSFQVIEVQPQHRTPSEDGWLEAAYEDRSQDGEP